MSDNSLIDESPSDTTKSEERNTFLFLAVFLAPILAFVLVGGYGFIIWMSQLIFGPPVY